MSTFEYPIQRFDAPTSASIEPKLSQREQNEREGIQNDTVSRIGSAACDSFSCHLCEYYLRDIEADNSNSGDDTSADILNGTKMSSTAITVETSFSRKVKEIATTFRQALRIGKKVERRRSDSAVESKQSSQSKSGKESIEVVRVLTNNEDYEGTPVQIRISNALYKGLEGTSTKSRDRVSVLRTKVHYHEELLRYLAKCECDVAAGDNEKHRAIVALQFEVIEIIRDLKEQLDSIERVKTHRFEIVSSVAG